MLYDISLPISDSLPVWPGDPSVTVTRTGTLPAVSQISLGSHAGTHVDPPAHFLPGGATVDQLPLEVLIGPAWVAHLPGPGPIGAATLEAAVIPVGTTRLLLRTENSIRRLVQSGFDTAFVALAPDAAAWLLDRGVRLIGIDGPSIEPYGAPGAPVHHVLLAAGVVIVENLALAEVAAGAYQLICLPLRITAGDGAPARAVLVGE